MSERVGRDSPDGKTVNGGSGPSQSKSEITSEVISPLSTNTSSNRLLSSKPIHTSPDFKSEASPSQTGASVLPLGVSSGGVSKTKQHKKQQQRIGWEGGGFGAYMREKERKLREQFTEEFGGNCGSENGHAMLIFKGVTVWVTGDTNPPRDKLRRILGAHGGKFEVYYSRERVTHIVASTLATATRLRLAGRAGAPKGTVPVHIVTPKWITQSVQMGKRLKESHFTVPGMKDPGQKSVKDMLGFANKGKK